MTAVTASNNAPAASTTIQLPISGWPASLTARPTSTPASTDAATAPARASTVRCLLGATVTSPAVTSGTATTTTASAWVLITQTPQRRTVARAEFAEDAQVEQRRDAHDQGQVERHAEFDDQRRGVR